MKVKIRRGIFETNSSSEHSLTVMNNDMYKRWKNGEVVAKIKTINEDDGTWGNFWSVMYTLEFTEDIEKANKENKEWFEKGVKDMLNSLERWKNECLNHKPTGDDYEDNHIYKFDEEYYNRMIKEYSSYTFEKNRSTILTFTDARRVWLTYEEFWNDYIENGDCYSPFQHVDEENNICIIGKYYHS